MLVLGTADVLGTDDLLGTADVERCSRQSAHRLQLESSVYSGPKKRSDGQVAAWALPAPNTDTPPARLGRPPLSGALTATAAWLGPPVSGGGGVATGPGTRPGPPAGVEAGRRSLTPVPLGPYLRPSERHPPEEAPELHNMPLTLTPGSWRLLVIAINGLNTQY